MRDFWERVLDFSDEIAARVGTKLLQDFGQVRADSKADGSLVTQSDRWADQTLRTGIIQEFSQHGILSEETSQVFPDVEWCWVVDPVDGTTNFTRGVPLWGISLALLYQGTPVFGYVYLPPVEQTFYAFCGKALEMDAPSDRAYLNGQPISPSQDDPSSNHFLNLCARSTDIIRRHPKLPCKIRMLGVATYNILTVAAGVSLAAVEATPKVWDIAAVWAIVQAAGGTWIALDSQPIFPLEPGKDYQDLAFPTLVVSREELVPVFKPLVESI